MKLFLLFIISLCTVSCSKETMNDAVEPIVPFNKTYQINFRLNWKEPAFKVPENAHVTDLIGMVHSRNFSLWSPGNLATKGLEDVAEEGKSDQINLELDDFISFKKALSKFKFPAPAINGGLDSILNLNQTFSCISFASMIAPSPD